MIREGWAQSAKDGGEDGKYIRVAKASPPLLYLCAIVLG